MSDALKTQIRDLAGFIDERQRAAAAVREHQSVERDVRPDDPVVEETPESWPGFEDDWDDPPAPVWSGFGRPQLVGGALGVAVAAATAVALVLLLSSSDTQPDVRAGGGDAPAASPASAGDAPVATPAVSSPTWSRVPHDESVLGGPSDQKMLGVTVGGPGLVAVGADGLDQMPTSAGKEGADAAVWTSADGVTWSRVPDDPSVFGGLGNQVMSSVTAGGPGLVAVGRDRSGGLSSVAAVWTSVDGITWSRVPHDEAVFGGDGVQEMKSVTVGGPGLVAVGHDLPNAAVWTSVDGLTWLRVPHDDAVFGGYDSGWIAEPVHSMEDVTVGGPGLVAVGQGGGHAYTQAWTGLGTAVVWTSVDGLTWSRVSDDEAVFGGEGDQWMTSVAAAGAGLVAVGFEGPNSDQYEPANAAVWTSPDGVRWSRVRLDEVVFGGEGHRIQSVAAGGAGLVAVGGDTTWSSAGGAIWSRAHLAGAVFGEVNVMHSVIAAGQGLVAVGTFWSGEPDGDDSVASVWVAAGE